MMVYLLFFIVKNIDIFFVGIEKNLNWYIMSAS